MSNYKIDKIVQRIIKETQFREKLLENIDYLKELNLTNEEFNALVKAEPALLSAVGMHPILQMHYMMFRTPEIGIHVSVNDCLAIKNGDYHG
ncbi:hypothetical protein CFH90_18260 (plasmid) [Acinetobacter johnsonii]|uniref:Extradiol ring-cleavage dioxygenase LigAB LigA subunit domain-containing protein n=1 Tax=Acinetobacter johnsonii TaxID=40214 RepID=A0A3Q8XHF7_ACIJO|nr:hypothetical protein [Acinetobacter johnsonii]AZN65856.1 hypothetical protein CFH90_18260 [Acinetobacter johnsonii]